MLGYLIFVYFGKEVCLSGDLEKFVVNSCKCGVVKI